MTSSYQIRLLESSDNEACREIYRPYIEESIISFEYEVPSLSEFSNRIAAICSSYPWLVCTYNGQVIGYAYASKHRDRTAYQWAAEVTVYIDSAHHRKGIARVLYQALFQLLRLQGYYTVYAGISLPNEKSVGFHRSMGFDTVGIYKNVGYKFGAWHNTVWMQLTLSELHPNPSEPKPLDAIKPLPSFTDIFTAANQELQKATIPEI